jgi:hypothetical protein
LDDDHIDDPAPPDLLHGVAPCYASTIRDALRPTC